MTDERILAERINELIARSHAGKGRDRALCDEIRAAQAELAAMFAAAHGWKLSTRWFSAGCLAVRGMHGHGSQCWPWPMLDHPNYFRSNARAAAATGCVYDIPRDANQWARANGLLLTVSDFPAWYWPAQCTLLVYTPLGLVANQRQPTRRRWPRFVSTATH